MQIARRDTDRTMASRAHSMDDLGRGLSGIIMDFDLSDLPDSIEKLQDILDETYVYVLTYSLYLLKFIPLYSMIFIYCLNCSNPCALKTICISSIAPGVGCSIGQHAGPSIECWEPQSYMGSGETSVVVVSYLLIFKAV